MEPIDLAAASAPAIHDIPSKFMLDPPTYVRGAELGFNGADFYFAGRGGVLGDVAGEIGFIFDNKNAHGRWRGGARQDRRKRTT